METEQSIFVHEDRRVTDPLSIPPAAKSGLHILIVDDDRTLREGCATLLQVEGYSPVLCGRGDEAIDMVRRTRFDIVLVDLYLTPVSGMEVLKAALEANRDSIVIVITGNPSVATNLEALRAGAWDYIPKPFSATHLQLLVGRAAHAVLVARETRAMRAQATIPDADRPPLVGSAKSFRSALDLASKVAMTDASVMLSGESGTGKEVIARYIHRNSRRASRKLVPINCAALPDALLESELFGHRKGAFTGADREKPGLLEAANGGTLFLDELTEMRLPLQAKLLRVIQDGVVRRVGSERQDALVDVRFISATNRDPHEAVRVGVLREDLFYRLRVVPIHLPPLRQRVEDIPHLVNHFLPYYWGRHRSKRDPLPEVTQEALDFLCARSWRGNVRELQNVMEHLAVLSEPGQQVRPEDIPVYADTNGSADSGFPLTILSDSFHEAKDKLVAHFEREYLSRLVARSGGNMSRAARLASIDRTTLYRLMEKHNFQRDDQDEPPGGAGAR